VICLVYIVYFSFFTVAAYMANKVVNIKIQRQLRALTRWGRERGKGRKEKGKEKGKRRKKRENPPPCYGLEAHDRAVPGWGQMLPFLLWGTILRVLYYRTSCRTINVKMWTRGNYIRSIDKAEIIGVGTARLRIDNAI